MTAPRIDTVRNTTNALIHRLGEALAHLEDLHAIGWYRHTNGPTRQRVAGGDPTAVGIDLDNHGDPRYRAAYEHLAKTILTAHDDVAAAITGALEHFATGTISSRRDNTADATSTEVLGALARQAQRHTTGDHTAPLVTQPLPAHARHLLQVERLQTQLEDLQSVIRKTEMRPDRSRLTPRELAAYQAAIGQTTRRRKTRKRP